MCCAALLAALCRQLAALRAARLTCVTATAPAPAAPAGAKVLLPVLRQGTGGARKLNRCSTWVGRTAQGSCAAPWQQCAPRRRLLTWLCIVSPYWSSLPSPPPLPPPLRPLPIALPRPEKREGARSGVECQACNDGRHLAVQRALWPHLSADNRACASSQRLGSCPLRALGGNSRCSTPRSDSAPRPTLSSKAPCPLSHPPTHS